MGPRVSALKRWLADGDYGDALVADGPDGAALGIVERCGQEPFVAYDLEKAIALLAERDGVSPDEAREFLEFNSVGAWVGTATPGWLVARFEPPAKRGRL